MAYPNTQMIHKVIEHDDPKALIEAAEEIGKKLARELKLTTNQIRNIFGTVRQIKMDWPSNAERSYRRAVLLRPKLAYQAKRAKEKGGKGRDALLEFEKVFGPAIDAVIEAPENERQGRFERVTDFLEAIVAYHKKYGGQ
jgi:CRISPR type III-A-associated protein Csm2